MSELIEDKSFTQRFVIGCQKNIEEQIGTGQAINEYHETLLQKLCIKISVALKVMEEKRLKDPNDKRAAYKWKNINIEQLMLDAVYVVQLGIDALIPNNIHVIPYWSKALELYNIDLRLGYIAKDYLLREKALTEPLDIFYELVYETDNFMPIKKSKDNPVESYNFAITEPFNRGKVIGGFGYIMYDNDKMNKLVIVTKADFDKAKQAARTQDFWGSNKWEKEMQYKTLIHKVGKAIPLDPKKINSEAYHYMVAKDSADYSLEEELIEAEIQENANKKLIDIKDENTNPSIGE